MFNVGAGEMIVIALILLMAVGPEQLPGLIRRVGRTVAEVKGMTEGLRSEFMSGLEEIERATDPEAWAAGSGQTKVKRPFDNSGGSSGAAPSTGAKETAAEKANQGSSDDGGTDTDDEDVTDGATAPATDDQDVTAPATADEDVSDGATAGEPSIGQVEIGDETTGHPEGNGRAENIGADTTDPVTGRDEVDAWAEQGEGRTSEEQP